MNYLWIWLIAVVIFAVLEGVTYQIISIWFALGSIGAFLAAYAGLGLDAQLAVFAGIAVVCVLLLRPISMRLIKKHGITKTNANALIGKKVLITKRVCNRTGEGAGRVNGLEWSVRSADDDVTFEKDEEAVIERIEGVKLIVRKKV